MSILLAQVFNQDISFRKATPEDSEWAYGFFKQSIGHIIEAQLGKWDDVAQRRFFFEYDQFPTENSVIIMRHGEPVGFTEIRESDDKVWIPHIYLRDDVQRLGLGSFICEKALAVAQFIDKPLKAETLKLNTAPQAMFTKLGFIQTGENKYEFTFTHRDTISNQPA